MSDIKSSTLELVGKITNRKRKQICCKSRRDRRNHFSKLRHLTRPVL